MQKAFTGCGAELSHLVVALEILPQALVAGEDFRGRVADDVGAFVNELKSLFVELDLATLVTVRLGRGCGHHVGVRDQNRADAAVGGQASQGLEQLLPRHS